MVALRARKLRTFLATLCLALTAVLVSQAPIATLDQALHSLSIDHPAITLAGQVYFDQDDHGADHDHEPQSEAPADGAGETPAHHHHSDGPQISLLPRSLGLRAPNDAPPAAGMIFGLERPPKMPLEVFA